MRPVLFIDRDGVVLQEPPIDFQIDSIDKTSFVKGSISALSQIAASFDYYKVMVTNQDGLGTDSYPEATFFPYHNLMLRTLEGEGFVFDEMIIDRTFAADNQPTRKPGTALLQHFFNTDQFDLTRSFVIGDRWSDIQLAKNLGCKAIYLKSPLHELTPEQEQALRPVIALETDSWQEIYTFLKLGMRVVHHERNTNETKISVALNLDGSGRAEIHTGLGFFDHMLDQLSRHSLMDLTVKTIGDTEIDDHHTVEDTGIALGQAVKNALGNKQGIVRYGSCHLPMDDAQIRTSLDFSARPFFIWNVNFSTNKIGAFDVELVREFFQAFSTHAGLTLHVDMVHGINNHHIAEAIFKSVARALRLAIEIDPRMSESLPSTKGKL